MTDPGRSITYDVVIVGGGVIGSAIAYFLSADPGFHGRIAVIERDPTYTIASSSLSTSGIRQQFATRPNVAMSAFGIQFLRNVKQHLSVEDHAADIFLREPGYLILGAKEHVAAFKARNQLQRSWGVPAELLSPNELANVFPGSTPTISAWAPMARNRRAGSTALRCCRRSGARRAHRGWSILRPT